MTKPDGRSTVTVFVVDDEPVIASTLTEILKLNGFDAQCFNNPSEALSAAGQFQPDLLITEVLLPEVSGIELANRLKRLCPTCKILLFSGHPETAEQQLGAPGVDHDLQFLTKPVRPEILLAHISNMTASRSGRILTNVS